MAYWVEIRLGLSDSEVITLIAELEHVSDYLWEDGTVGSDVLENVLRQVREQLPAVMKVGDS
jgi:hypothetical protein